MARRLLSLTEDDEAERRDSLRVQRKRLRDASDPFDIHEPEFIGIYRMPQQLVMTLRDEIKEYMEETSISKEIRILIALSFLAEGICTFQKKIGLSYLNCVSQSVVSRSIQEFCTIMDDKQMTKYIIFPQSSDEMNAIKLQFYEKFNLPGIIGCIDCTHVSMFRPAAEVEHVYLNRHHYHSKNVQIICDSNLRILNVNARYGGSNHDASIWRKSLVKAFLHNKYDAGQLQNTYLLGK